MISVGSRAAGTRQTHRIAYEEFVGPVPNGLHLDHRCRVRLCCNPAHLEPVTQQENNRRSWAARGLKSHCAQGHEFTPENTKQTAKQRKCRECIRAQSKAKREKQRKGYVLPPLRAREDEEVA